MKQSVQGMKNQVKNMLDRLDRFEEMVMILEGRSVFDEYGEYKSHDINAIKGVLGRFKLTDYDLYYAWVHNPKRGPRWFSEVVSRETTRTWGFRELDSIIKKHFNNGETGGA